jgi:hypothetical protein
MMIDVRSPMDERARIQMSIKTIDMLLMMFVNAMSMADEINRNEQRHVRL